MASRKRDPQPGDLIEINRGVYQHWALYLGDGYVIHVTAEDEGIPHQSSDTAAISAKKTKVKMQLLTDVAGKNNWKVNNKYDQSHTPLPVKEIIERAESYIDTEWTYHLLNSNCEHFVTMLRYGKEDSRKARIGNLFTRATLKVAAIAVGSVGAVILTASGVGPVAAVGATVGAITVGGVAAFLVNSRSSGNHSGNKRKSN